MGKINQIGRQGKQASTHSSRDRGPLVVVPTRPTKTHRTPKPPPVIITARIPESISYHRSAHRSVEDPKSRVQGPCCDPEFH